MVLTCSDNTMFSDLTVSVTLHWNSLLICLSLVGLLAPEGQGACLICHCIPSTCCLVAKLCLTLCDPIDCSPPGCSAHGISQATVLEWCGLSSPSPGNFLTQGLNLRLLHWQEDSLPLSLLGIPSTLPEETQALR